MRLERFRTIAIGLFLASAAFVAWRTTQVAVLVDLAYIVNIATRISLGDVPYSDFPLAQAPGSFLVQAALIRLVGPHYPVLVAYVAIAGGIAASLTYFIVLRLLDPQTPRRGLVALTLSLPAVPLGIYAIFPHPFYDSDACLLALAAIALLLFARQREGLWPHAVAGALVPLPLFVKQNIGGPFLVLVVGGLALEAVRSANARTALRATSVGALVSLLIALTALHMTSGLGQVIKWTWTYALEGRGVSSSRLAMFVDIRTVWPGIVLLGLILASRWLKPRTKAICFFAALALPVGVVTALPTAMVIPELWPPLALLSCVLVLIRSAKEVQFERLLPVICVGTAAGAALSQGLYSSTFGTFPLLCVVLAVLVNDIRHFVDTRRTWIGPMTGVALAVLIASGGAVYTMTNARLGFVDLAESESLARSTYPSLAGLSARGRYVSELDQILYWIDANVPASDPIGFLPGEDPIYYGLGRRPPLPAVYFYDVASPLSPEEIERAAIAVGLRWVFVKDVLQLRETPPTHPELVRRLTRGMGLVQKVGTYSVYRRP